MDRSPDATTGARCAVARLLGPDGFAPQERPDAVDGNTVAGVLSGSRGSCAGLVATILALTERASLPLHAVVLRDHVLLGVDGDKPTLFETLRGGAEVSADQLARYRIAPDGIALVPPSRFLPFYLDNVGARLVESGNIARALELLREAATLAPRSGRIRFNLGTALLRVGQPREALSELDAAIRYGWDDADAWVNRGVALQQLGRPQDAGASYREALRIEPSRADAARNLDELARREGTRRH